MSTLTLSTRDVLALMSAVQTAHFHATRYSGMYGSKKLEESNAKEIAVYNALHALITEQAFGITSPTNLTDLVAKSNA